MSSHLSQKDRPDGGLSSATPPPGDSSQPGKAGAEEKKSTGLRYYTHTRLRIVGKRGISDLGIPARQRDCAGNIKVNEAIEGKASEGNAIRVDLAAQSIRAIRGSGVAGRAEICNRVRRGR